MKYFCKYIKCTGILKFYESCYEIEIFSFGRQKLYTVSIALLWFGRKSHDILKLGDIR